MFTAQQIKQAQTRQKKCLLILVPDELCVFKVKTANFEVLVSYDLLTCRTDKVCTHSFMGPVRSKAVSCRSNGKYYCDSLKKTNKQTNKKAGNIWLSGRCS